jgi:hypothetical protein
MHCYAGLAKRIVNSTFPRVIPVPQLQPLDARNIIKLEVWTEMWTEAWAEAGVWEATVEDAVWRATLVWADAKARGWETSKAVSETDTDESYDSDDSEVGVPTYHASEDSRFSGRGLNPRDYDIYDLDAWQRAILAWHARTRDGRERC